MTKSISHRRVRSASTALVVADTLVGDFAFVPHAELVAVASRSAPRAQTFATKHGIEHAFGNYIELIESPEVDVLYIATRHPQHLQIGLAAVRAGKAILVEKAFTATLAGAIELVEEARTQKVFAMEAMWTRFQPAVVRARELIASGAIGSVRSVKADLGVVRDYDPADPRSAYELGSGALLDLGVYLASFAQMVLGAPTRVTSNGSLEPSGVDAEASLLVEFEGGCTATLMCSLHSPTPSHARIIGTAGWIDVPCFHHPDIIVLHRHGAEPEKLTLPPLGLGYAHELIEVTESILAGRSESSTMTLADSLDVQGIVDSALTQLGVRYTEDAHALDQTSPN
jgi:predicted dehydrogenase